MGGFVSGGRSASPSTPTGLALRGGAVAQAPSRALPIEDRELLQPDEEPDRQAYLIGFTTFAENFNGRIAMIAFFIIIFLEFFTDKSLFKLAGEIFNTSV